MQKDSTPSVLSQEALAEMTPEQREWAKIEAVLATGNLKQLTAEQRVLYYRKMCSDLGLNPLTQPFAYVEFQGKLVLYPLKGATDQIRENKGISITNVDQQFSPETGILTVTVYGRTPEGREDSDVGALWIGQLKGEALANAVMKTVTKGKRRLTLSICGLGMSDETEVETVPGARFPHVNLETGEISPGEQRALPPMDDEKIKKRFARYADLRAEYLAYGMPDPGEAATVEEATEKATRIWPILLAEREKRKSGEPAAAKATPVVKAPYEGPDECSVCGVPMNKAQMTLSIKKFDVPLCTDHQRARASGELAPPTPEQAASARAQEQKTPAPVEREMLLAAWKGVTEAADRYGLEYQKLPSNAAEDLIKARGKALQETYNQVMTDLNLYEAYVADALEKGIEMDDLLIDRERIDPLDLRLKVTKMAQRLANAPVTSEVLDEKEPVERIDPFE